MLLVYTPHNVSLGPIVDELTVRGLVRGKSGKKLHQPDHNVWDKEADLITILMEVLVLLWNLYSITLV